MLFVAAIIGSGLAALHVGTAASDDITRHDGAPDNAQKCLVALVNPVTGHAECVNPAGAPVAQPDRDDVPCAVDEANRKPDLKACGDPAGADQHR